MKNKKNELSCPCKGRVSPVPVKEEISNTYRIQLIYTNGAIKVYNNVTAINPYRAAGNMATLLSTGSIEEVRIKKL